MNFTKPLVASTLLGKVIPLGPDIAMVEIDQDGLHRDDVVGFGLALSGYGAGDDVEGEPALRSTLCFVRNVLRQIRISAEERGPRPLVGISLFRELPDRHPSFALAEQNVREDCDRGMIRTRCRRDIRSGAHDQPYFAAGRPARPFA
jgi:hypothetical protein